jgi:hypothetical protein
MLPPVPTPTQKEKEESRVDTTETPEKMVVEETSPAEVKKILEIPKKCKSIIGHKPQKKWLWKKLPQRK